MKTYITLLLTCVFSLSAFAQLKQTHTGVYSTGEIPEDFTKFTIEKIEEAKQQTDENATKDGKEADEEFYEAVNFGIDELLQSGRVVFNDTISRYVHKVFEVIRDSNPEIPDNIRIYTVKSPVVNAFATDQGIIFINTGLIAQLDNEAQLAFVLCHEVIHYMEDHVMEGFKASKDIQQGHSDYREIKTVDRELATTRFSRKMENEADKKGLALFLNTDYDPSQIEGVFDVLLYSFLPFADEKFDSTILEVGNYKIPGKYFKDELDKVEVDEDVNDARHTHPNIGKRRKRTKDLLEGEVMEGDTFIVSKEEFIQVRAAARFEVLRLQLVSGDYSDALYSAFLLEKEFPENPAPQIAIGELLYGTALFANTDDRRSVVGSYKRRQGNVQQAYYVLNRIPAKDMTFLAARYNYMLLEKDPENEIIQERIQTLFTDLVYYHNMEFEDLHFEIYNPDSVKKPTSIRKVSSTVNQDEEKEEKKEVPQFPVKNWELWTFSGCDCENQIEEWFEKGKEASDEKKYLYAELKDEEENEKSLKEQEEEAKEIRKHGVKLGIDKIVIIDPFYGIINETDEEGYKQMESEMQEIDQLDQLDEIAKKADLQLEILTNYRFNSDDVQKFNDFSLLNEWVNERFLIADRGSVISSTEEIQELIERYNTKYFAWAGTINTKYRKRNVAWNVFLCATIIGLPFGLYNLITPDQETLVYFAMFNVESGELVMYEERLLKGGRNNNGLLNSHYYDIFYQIKQKEDED